MYGCTLVVNYTDFRLYHSNICIYIDSCNFRFYNQIFVQLFYCFQNSFILHIMARHVFRALCLISGITTKFETHQYCIVNKFNFDVNSCVLDFFSVNRTSNIIVVMKKEIYIRNMLIIAIDTLALLFILLNVYLCPLFPFLH